MKLNRPRRRTVRLKPRRVMPPSSVRLKDATSMVVEALRRLGWTDADIRPAALGALVKATKGIGRTIYDRPSGWAMSDIPGLFLLALDDDPSPWQAERAAEIVSAELDALLGIEPTALDS